MKPLIVVLSLLVPSVHADLVITEAMAKSSHSTSTMNGDWWELTNTGTTAVNLSGYKWDDTPEPAPTVSIFPNLSIEAGETIIILQESAANAAAWKSAWELTSTQVVDRDQFTATGGEGFSSLSKDGDEVNLFDPAGNLVAHAEFGASFPGKSHGFLRDGTPIYGLFSAAGEHGAIASTQSPADTASPGDAGIHFNSAPTAYGMSTYSYSVLAAAPGSITPTISAASIPSFLTLVPGAGGTATLSNNRPLTLADAGDYLVRLTATGGSSSTVQEYNLTILNPSPSVILNEYNAVDVANFLNGGTLTSDDDGGDLSADVHFGRVAGNGGQWVEFVVVGNGGPGLLDMRGWKIEIGKNLGLGFAVRNTLVLSNHADWQSIPSGTVLTFTVKTTAQGGLDSGFAIRDRLATAGDTWTNIWMGDPDHLTYTSFSINGFTLSAGVVSGIIIDNSGTQFRVRNASGQIVFGPVGEGVAPLSGTNSKEVFELENHPTPLISPIVASSETAQGYGDGAVDSTFGSPNNWLDGVTPVAQSFTPYVVNGFSQWAAGHGLTGDSALRSADPDADGRDNFNEYAFGGDPKLKDGPHAAGSVASGALVGWTYVRRNDDPALTFGHESSEDLVTWSPAIAVSTTSGSYPADPRFSSVTVRFDRPVPAPAKWFLRAKVE